MKKIIALALVSLTLLAFNAAAVEVNFTWTKPDPAFINPDGTPAQVDPDWVIDEYRIYCTDVAGTSQDYQVQGYDTEAFTGDLSPGLWTCQLTAYSIGADSESAATAAVTKFVHAGGRPNAPGGFDFSFDTGGT